MANLGPFTTHLIYIIYIYIYTFIIQICTEYDLYYMTHGVVPSNQRPGGPWDLMELWKCWEIGRNDPPESEAGQILVGDWFEPTDLLKNMSQMGSFPLF